MATISNPQNQCAIVYQHFLQKSFLWGLWGVCGLWGLRQFQGFSSPAEGGWGGGLVEGGGGSHGSTPLLGGPASDARTGQIGGIDGGGGVSRDAGCNPFLGGGSMFAYNAVSSSMAEFILRIRIRSHWMPVKKLEFFYPPSTIWPSTTHF